MITPSIFSWKPFTLVLLLALTLAGCGEPSSDTVIVPVDDELAPERDNGAQGLDPLHNPAHVAPIDACADPLTASDQSLVIRVLPKGPENADGSLAFTSGVCVYLPPGYMDSGLSYPVLYLLHGGGGDAGDWVTYGGLRSIMDGLIAADASNAAIVVMPDGTDAQWYDSFDGRLRNQEYVLDYLIPYVDRHFRTIAERDGRIIDGLSNGGYGSMLLSAKAPDRFRAAGAMSANLAGLLFPGLADVIAPAYHHGNLPIELASNLDDLALTMDIGTVCITDQARDNCFAYRFEQFFVPANRAFSSELESVRPPMAEAFDYRETEGGHSWNWWPLWLRERHLPFLLGYTADPRPSRQRVTAPQPPEEFRYRSIANDFSVWGYDVTVDRGVREFLDLNDVTATGLAVQGSGHATIRTAAIYRHGRTYRVVGATGAAQSVDADRDGRLVFDVDLGPAHQFEQFTAQADALEAAGDYWVVRTIDIQ